MHQPIKLQLNAEAVAALFPEDSPARIELQNAVVAEFVRKHLRERILGSDVHSRIETARGSALTAIESARRDVIDRVVREAGVAKDNWGRMTVTGSALSEITEAAKQAVHREIEKAIKASIDAMVERLNGRITHDAQVAVNNLLNREIEGAVRARVQEVMANLGKVA